MSNGRVGPNWGFSLITTVVMVMATTDVVTMADEEETIQIQMNEWKGWPQLGSLSDLLSIEDLFRRSRVAQYCCQVCMVDIC